MYRHPAGPPVPPLQDCLPDHPGQAGPQSLLSPGVPAAHGGGQDGVQGRMDFLPAFINKEHFSLVYKFTFNFFEQLLG